MRAALHAQRPPDEARAAPLVGEEVAQLADGGQQAERRRRAADVRSRPVKGLALKTVEFTAAAGIGRLEKGFFSRSVVLPHWLLTAVQRGKGSLRSVTKDAAGRTSG